MAANVPYFELNNGVQMPGVAAGCWLGVDGDVTATKEMCLNALKVGYRHLDTAPGYGNERYVGEAIRESGIPREEIFVTTKLGHFHDVRGSFEDSLAALDVGYIDLYLIHWPQTHEKKTEPWNPGRVLSFDEHPNFVDAWRDMEDLLATGKVRALGVCNFSAAHLETLLAHARVVPAVNQVEAHPCLPQHALQAACAARGIRLCAYAPFAQGNPVFFDDEDLKAVAGRHGVTPAQVVVSWLAQRGVPPIAKSARVERMRTNISLVTLSEEDMRLVDAIHTKPGMHRSLLAHTQDGVVFGWTYEQLGWAMGLGGVVLE
ncbi:aldo/keto reductase [Phanerochaete sordida]|uniref:Aldo/keto reductase n=1 Tax=Phanerochaete sordida TaxID=48140 RepID=A0A9P3GP23_9APHY|nr:aldo/keto reductase [Phanerochaete sordida]